METTTRTQRRYDHRLQSLVKTTGDISLAVREGVPRSTARGWLTRSNSEVVTLDVLELETERLAAELMQRHAMTLEEVKQAIEPLMDDE